MTFQLESERGTYRYEQRADRLVGSTGPNWPGLTVAIFSMPATHAVHIAVHIAVYIAVYIAVHIAVYIALMALQSLIACSMQVWRGKASVSFDIYSISSAPGTLPGYQGMHVV